MPTQTPRRERDYEELDSEATTVKNGRRGQTDIGSGVYGWFLSGLDEGPSLPSFSDAGQKVFFLSLSVLFRQLIC